MPLNAVVCISSLLPGQSHPLCPAALLSLWESDGFVKSLLVSIPARLGLPDLEWPSGGGNVGEGVSLALRRRQRLAWSLESPWMSWALAGQDPF